MFDMVRSFLFVVKRAKEHQKIRTRNRAYEYADNARAAAGDIKASSGERGIILLSAYPRQCRYRHCRGFWSQGDGASFEGSWSYARGPVRAIRAHAPRDEELHRIAHVLQDVQRRNLYQLHTRIRQNGHYCHENTMTIEVERNSPFRQPMTDDAEAAVVEALRDLARWLYRQLECEYTHITSDEAVDETIAINMWTFTAGGERFG